MYPLLSAEQSRAVEAAAMARNGDTVDDLMRRAGAAVADLVNERIANGDVVVLAGPGNNGGDGWVAAHDLHAAGRRVTVLSTREVDELTDAAGRAARRAVEAGVRHSVPQSPPTAAQLGSTAVVIDALLGTGSGLPLRGPIAAWCDAASASGAWVLAVDVPTGVDADSGAVDEHALMADVTLSFIAPKRGVVMYPGASYAGEVVVADIGVADDLLGAIQAPQVWTAQEYAELVPVAEAEAHKNSRGRVLVVAGSGSFPGAAVLAARGAMRMGAGYVTLAVPSPIVRTAQAHLLAAPVVGLPAIGGALSSSAVPLVRELAADYDALVIGPGLTLSDGAVAAVRLLVAGIDRPMVIDADGLNAFVDHEGLLRERSAPTVLTPHPGELARLLGLSTRQVQADRLAAASRLSGPRRSVVLKGAGTVVSNGETQLVNTSGSAVLATAGTGDVLAGMVGTLLAQGLSPLSAGALGAYVHGRAGEVLAASMPVGATAEDLPDAIPVAVRELLGDW